MIVVACVLFIVLLCIITSDVNIKVKIICGIGLAALVFQAVGFVAFPKVTTKTYTDIIKYEDNTISYTDGDNKVLLVSEECMRVDTYIDDECRLDEVTRQFGLFKIISYVFYVPEDVYKSGNIKQ